MGRDVFFGVAEQGEAAHSSVGFAMEAKRWERDESEMRLLSVSASLDVTRNQFLSEPVVVPRLRIGRDFAGEGTERGTPAVGVDGIADFGELVGVAGVAEDLENGDVDG